MENPIKIDDLGIPLFLETPIYLLNQTFGSYPHLAQYCSVAKPQVRKDQASAPHPK